MRGSLVLATSRTIKTSHGRRRRSSWAFAGVSIHQLTNPYDTLAFRLDVLHDIGSAHKSTVFSPNVEFSTPVSRRTYVSLSAGAEFVGNKYADYYYTITPADSILTGGALPVASCRTRANLDHDHAPTQPSRTPAATQT